MNYLLGGAGAALQGRLRADRDAHRRIRRENLSRLRRAFRKGGR
jgi:hypothetical protein